MEYTIDGFWKSKFSCVKSRQEGGGLPGWHHSVLPLDSFVEADLSLRQDRSDLGKNIWFIAAAGAVGKSTFAQEVCARTNAIYLDLASAATVGGNFLVGGLVNSGLYEEWQSGRVVLFIDALDEARLRVTQAAFEDFLSDVVKIANRSCLPIVLLGRVGIVEESWRYLNDCCGVSSPIFDIELFDFDKAKKFVESTLRRLAKKSKNGEDSPFSHLAKSVESHEKVYQDAIHTLVSHLTSVTDSDGRQFVGYAPVLDAVATVIASEPNPSKVPSAVESILTGRVLGRVTELVMERESVKLSKQIKESMPGLETDDLYNQAEQLKRLASFLFGTGAVDLPSSLPQTAAALYDEAVQSLLPQHPFLDSGSEKPIPASAVFAACIVAAALRGDDPIIARSAENYAQSGYHAPNPFLLDFYLKLTVDDVVPASHVGLLYESLQAKAVVGDIARISIEGDEEQGLLEADMSLVPLSGDDKNYEFKVAKNGPIRFGRRLGGVNINAEYADVEIGNGGQLELVAPISIFVKSLILTCDEMVVKPDPAFDAKDQVVFLEAGDALAEIRRGVPDVRSGVVLQVAWEGSRIYPWTPFSCAGKEDDNSLLAEAQRSLRRLCISFRSHSKGRLARYQGKIEHFRMTKGTVGVSLREKLKTDDVLSLEGPMYFLDPDALGRVVGIAFQDLKMKKYSDSTNEYLRRVLDEFNRN